MKKALLVIDAQEDFIGDQRNKQKFNYDDVDELINNINEKIKMYKKNGDEVIYIAEVLPNKLFYRKFFGFGISGSVGSKIHSRIEIVSENYFEKQFANAFTNKNLLKFIREKKIEQVELIGVDGSGCISETAKGAIKAGLKVTVLNDSVGTISQEKFIKTSRKLKEFGVAYI